MEGLMEQFAATQKEAATAFNASEEKRLKTMVDMEERRLDREMAMREADRRHEERMMQMMMTLANPAAHHMPPPAQRYATAPHQQFSHPNTAGTSLADTSEQLTTLLNMPHY